VQLLWSESGGSPTPLEGQEVSQRGSNIAEWSADGHLVTGLCCTLSTRVHVWSADGERLRTIEFGVPTWWQVGKERVFGETEEGPPGSRTLLLRSWRLRDGEARILGRVPTSVKGPSVPRAFLPDGTGWVHVRENALFVRPLAAGTIGGERLVGRHGAAIDLLLADEKARDRLISRDKTGEIRLWRPGAGRLELDRVIPRPANAPPSVFPAEPRWVHGRPGIDKKVRLWNVEALPGSRPLELRRSGSWYLTWPGLHPRGDWLTVFQWREGRAAFWPLRKRCPSVVDGYTPIHRPVAFSPDGRWLATTWSDSKLRLWPLSSTGPREPRVLELPEAALFLKIVFDPHGQYIFAVGGSDRAWIVPLDGTPPRRLPVYSESTVLFAAAVSPSGWRVATAWNYGPGPRTLRTLRLHDVETGETRVFPLPMEAASARFAGGGAVRGCLEGIGFLDETTAYTSGWAGLRRWDLEKGTSELVAADVDFIGFLGPDRRLGLTGAPMPGREAKSCRQLQTRDLVSGETKPVGPPGVCVSAPPAAVSGEVFAAPGPDGVLVGRVSGDTAHLLVGHEGPVEHVAVSPDAHWVATSGEDNTLRLWPMPDLSKPPLHTLPHEELLARLKSLTNLRVVRAPESPAGWKIDVGPFPGWKDVPTW
jgi:WD40 repeat protein